MKVQVIVWGENILEREDAVVARLCPYGMHTCIADALNAQPGIVAGTATLEEPEHGLTAERLAATDVLVWCHRSHERAADHVVERVAEQVWGAAWASSACTRRTSPRSSAGRWGHPAR